MRDAERMRAILAQLPAADADFLRAQIGQPWERRAHRLAERDAAVREALAVYRGKAPYAAAKAVEQELRHAACAPHATGPRAALLRRIIDLSDRRGLAWRRIVDIGEDLQKKSRTLQTEVDI